MTYALCGLRVGSDLPLPELPPWAGGDRAPDVEVRLGEVPERLARPVYERPWLQVGGDGRCRFAVADVAVYLVEAGRSVIVQPCPHAEAADVRVFLLGTTFGILCHQRGLLPLHAGCVAIGGRAVAFTGESGEGKSTLTAAFLRGGHPVLADDITVLDACAVGGPQVLPSIPRIKLKRDAAAGLGLSAAVPNPGWAETEKLHLPVGERFRTGPLPLAAVYHLSTTDDADRTGIERLRGVAAMDALLEAVYRRPLALHMGRRAPLLEAMMRLVALPSFRLVRLRDLGAIDATVAAIAARHGG
ncbi:serine kinase [Azospirillum sp. TSO22-1]|uniref:serine kinase n=1 Tax=Azospirillum sp. TSO22-1 TaxID=716789 RepID=UPI000D6173FE|nr:serine kinase [Azospirillum sp. TSO22-1]PWC52993.1 hypothetical protein TSO221_12245 [Azospirillum sp. TSO22-1]